MYLLVYPGRQIAQEIVLHFVSEDGFDSESSVDDCRAEVYWKEHGLIKGVDAKVVNLENTENAPLQQERTVVWTWWDAGESAICSEYQVCYCRQGYSLTSTIQLL